MQQNSNIRQIAAQFERVAKFLKLAADSGILLDSPQAVPAAPIAAPSPPAPAAPAKAGKPKPSAPAAGGKAKAKPAPTAKPRQRSSPKAEQLREHFIRHPQATGVEAAAALGTSATLASAVKAQLRSAGELGQREG